MVAAALGVAALAVHLSPAGAETADPDRWDGLFGATPPDPALAAKFPRVQLKRAYIPSAIDLTPRMPPPVQQEKGSCVAHAMGYAVRGYYAAIEHSSTPGDPKNTPSPAYIHTQVAGWEYDKPRTPSVELCEKSGSNALLTMLYLMDNGSMTNQDVPISKICAPDVTSTQVGKNEFSIKGGDILFPLGENEPFTDTDIDKMKQLLAAGNPIVIGMNMYKAKADSEAALLQFLGKDDVYRGSLGENFGKMNTGHELAIVGYDDGRQAFRVQNSWGTDWADGGYGWVAYGALKADINEAAVIDAGITPPRPEPVQPKRDTPSVTKAGDCGQVFKVGSTYDGFVESEEKLAELKKEFPDASMDHVAVRPWPVCEALLTLDQPLGVSSRPRITLDSGSDKVKFGDLVGFSVTSPNFPSFLYVVYLQADGQVVNLVPRRGPLRKQLPPGTVLKFGDGKEGRQRFRAAAPAGPEAIVAIASRSPLGQIEALETSGTGQFRLSAGDRKKGEADPQDRLYLSQLRAALAENPDPAQTAREVTADVVHLTVSAN
jgi:hypothetical protein